MILRTGSVMYLADNFYAVRLQPSSHSCSALSFNWKCIPQFARQILTQVQSVHQHGYCLVNLKWRHLGKNGITTSDYPAKIDHQGRISEPVRVQYEDGSPELLYGARGDVKVDTWAFAQILLRFVFGVEAESLHKQLEKHLDGRERPTHFD